MIKIEKTEVVGWEHAIRGMRNPMNSWDKSDTIYETAYKLYDGTEITTKDGFIGKNDLDLMKRLVKAGTDHRKFMRMIICYFDANAPLYWHKEMDTYRFGIEKNSCSTMHKIHSKEFTVDDFSVENLSYINTNINLFNDILDNLNHNRKMFIETKDKKYWWNMIQLLPSSYNQKRTYMVSYEALANIYKSRKAHKLDEWREFCKWVETLPYSELITENKGE